MSTLRTLGGEPVTWDVLAANVDAWYVLHGPYGLTGWVPEPPVDPVTSNCTLKSHAACRGWTRGGYGCTCWCHQ
jgi:hypothetical protein